MHANAIYTYGEARSFDTHKVDLHCDATERCHTRLDLAAAFHWLIFHVAFFVFAEAFPRLDHPLLKSKGNNVSLTIQLGKADTASNTQFLAAYRRFTIAPGGWNFV